MPPSGGLLRWEGLGLRSGIRGSRSNVIFAKKNMFPRDCLMRDKCRRCKRPRPLDCPNVPNAWNLDRDALMLEGPSRDPMPGEALQVPAGSAPSSSRASRRGGGDFIGLSIETAANGWGIGVDDSQHKQDPDASSDDDDDSDSNSIKESQSVLPGTESIDTRDNELDVLRSQASESSRSPSPARNVTASNANEGNLSKDIVRKDKSNEASNGNNSIVRLAKSNGESNVINGNNSNVTMDKSNEVSNATGNNSNVDINESNDEIKESNVTKGISNECNDNGSNVTANSLNDDDNTQTNDSQIPIVDGSLPGGDSEMSQDSGPRKRTIGDLDSSESSAGDMVAQILKRSVIKSVCRRLVAPKNLPLNLPLFRPIYVLVHRPRLLWLLKCGVC